MRDRAAHRRNVETDVPEWKCQFCGKVLASESTFMRHQCTEMLRSNELKTPIGQGAYAFYCDWMRQYGRKAPSIETFASSRYYQSFVRFAKRVVDTHMHNPDSFVRVMFERDISPTLWNRDECFTLYLEYLDKAVPPLEQVRSSIETMLEIVEREEVEGVNPYAYLGTRRIIDLLSKKKLSPWHLFCSKKFGEFLKSVDRTEWEEMSAVLCVSTWSAKMEASRSIVADAVSISDAVGL